MTKTQHSCHGNQRPEEVPSAADMRRIAVRAACDPRSVRAVYCWQPMRQLVYERIVEAVERLGMADVYPVPPRAREPRHIQASLERGLGGVVK